MLYSLANNGKLSGRADGNVYMRNGRIRAFKVPALVLNAATAAVKSRLGQNSSDWNSLDDSERATWNNASGYSTTDRFGNSVPLKGKNLFVSLNNNLLAVGVPSISECPLPELVDGILTLTPSDFDVSVGTLTLSFTGTPTNADVKHLLFATAPQSAGTSRPGKSKFKVIAIISGTTASPYNAAADYITVFGTPPVGAKIFYKTTPILTTTGQSGVSVIAQGVAVA